MQTPTSSPQVPILPYLAVTTAMFFWGLSFVWTKIAFTAFGPLTVIFLRMLFSSILLFGTLFLFRRLQPAKASSHATEGAAFQGTALRAPSRQELKTLFFLAFFEPFLYHMGESFGLMRVDASLAALIIATIPIFVLILAPFFANERITLAGTLGVILSFIGLSLTIIGPNLVLRGDLTGILLVFGAVASGVAYGFITRKLCTELHALVIVAHQNLFGALLFFPFFALFEGQHFLQATPSQQSLLSLAALTLLPSTVSFLLYNYVIANIGVVRANVFCNIIPIVAVVFSVIFLGETFDGQRGMGMALVIVGVGIAQIPRRS